MSVAFRFQRSALRDARAIGTRVSLLNALRCTLNAAGCTKCTVVRPILRCYRSGFPHSEISGSKVVWHLPEAYRSQTTSFIASFSQGIHHAPLMEHPVWNSTNRFVFVSLHHSSKQEWWKLPVCPVRLTVNCSFRFLCNAYSARKDRSARPLSKRSMLSACRFQCYVIVNVHTYSGSKKAASAAFRCASRNRHLTGSLSDSLHYSYTWALL